MQLRFDNMLSQQKQHYSIDLSAAQTKLENAGDDTFVLYNPLEGYGYVKNLLISFDDVLSDQLKEYQNLDRSKEQYLAKRAELLDGIIVKDLTDGLDEEDREYGDISKFYDEIIKLSDYSGTD